MLCPACSTEGTSTVTLWVDQDDVHVSQYFSCKACRYSESRDRRQLSDETRESFYGRHGASRLILRELPLDRSIANSVLKKALKLSEGDVAAIIAKLPEASELAKAPEPVVRGLQDLLSEAGFKTDVIPDTTVVRPNDPDRDDGPDRG
jgi:hypothetical protein